MSQNSSDIPTQSFAKPKLHWWLLVAIPVWVVVGFLFASALVSGVMLYLVCLAIIVGLPWAILHRKITRADIGMDRLPNWIDIWVTPIALIVYVIASSALLYAATTYVPGFDSNQAQNVGFNQLNAQYQYILAFVTLVIIAPVAEEILFRGYLFGKLKKLFPLWVAILVTSIVFAGLHGAWNLALDTFALSIVLCLLRVSTGSLWAPILLHMTKNGIAYYILFINPVLLNTIGG
jgi:uncharacterized protein